MINEILSDTKMLLNIADNDKDELLSFYINDAKEAILAKCRIEFLPRQLYGLTAKIAMEMYTAAQSGNVSSIAEGDRKIVYSSNAKDLLSDFDQRLRPFMNIKGILPSEVDQ